MELRYGVNPHQKPASAEINNRQLPFTVVNGAPGYINLLDALNSWQLVKELALATQKFAAASFKHVSPAGAAIADSLAEAYRRARNIDPTSSYGDWIALSDHCDLETAQMIKPLVSDGVIAPGYDADALELLRAKRGGKYCVLAIDPNYEPPELESREVYGVALTQARNTLPITADLLNNVVTDKKIPESAKTDLIVAMITAKYTQSNTVVYTINGQAIGVGAGQQSRLACTEIAGNKADEWFRRNGIAPDGLCLASDAFFPFADNIERAAKSGVQYIAQPGGSIRDAEVIEACNRLGIAMCFTGLRLFTH